jgi:hypothetical protein
MTTKRETHLSRRDTSSSLAVGGVALVAGSATSPRVEEAAPPVEGRATDRSVGGASAFAGKHVTSAADREAAVASLLDDAVGALGLVLGSHELA